MLLRLGEFDEARHLAEQSLEIRQHFCKETPSAEDRRAVSVSLARLAEIVESQGDYRLAADYALQSLEIQRSLYPPERFPEGHPELATALQNAGATVAISWAIPNGLLNTPRLP